MLQARMAYHAHEEGTMRNKNPQQAGASTPPSQPANPGFGSLQTAGPAAGTTSSQPNIKEQLQNVLPELNALAQKVGGMKRLAELTNALAQAKE
jgi:hypothetical protein